MPLRVQELIHKFEEGAGYRYLKFLLGCCLMFGAAVAYDLAAFRNISTPEGMVTFGSDSPGASFGPSKTCALSPLDSAKSGCSLEYTPSQVGSGNHTITADYSGDAVDIAFNAQYLLDFLGAAGTETVALTLKNAESQGLLRPSADTETDYRYIVMPMRL